jgi:hypothetical protein
MEYDTGKLFEQLLEQHTRQEQKLDWIIKRLNPATPPAKKGAPDIEKDIKEVFKDNDGVVL